MSARRALRNDHPITHCSPFPRLMFRAEKDRNAYITTVENRMAAAGVEWVKMRELVPGKNSSTDGYQLSCRLFKMHVLEHER